ncbi:MAG: PEP-CTERM sorting domain-containing protein [Acidobacteriaceae bacterium]|nr:PEP-CTERM sorting domain-containing protein [Acidobacteriaceae bacterium]MBV9034709.1 PEP-CTERM sorting domain-containing protein [Acidobacteriaceae bacterium]MBV9304523.1 PEP-CTERM sorting domain-containing protein [Acidobacteriaceae bacterium]MBV9677876.1 PEP-CTERM sorting domain-containing protein [Acidobacteriaceae bacterium]MBV9936883.1 PEP-CTERM sorting domain-containing protein [Acidobacteriaceae bacterium]
MRKLSQLLATTALLFTATVLANADPIDPVFTMSDPDAGTPVLGTSFSFSSNGSGGGFFSFVNQSQLDWKGLAVQVLQPTGTPIVCSGGPFFPTCLISSIPQTGNLSLFTLNLVVQTKEGGLFNNQFFTINLNNLIGNVQPTDPNGSGGWGPNASFMAQVTDSTPAVPEPGTWLLLPLGLALVLTIRRSSKTAVH